MVDSSQNNAAGEDIELTDVLLTMDVVDTLRYNRSLVERELGTEATDQAMVAKVRKLYADQGLTVSDDIIAEAVAALREERFTYRPPKKGVSTLLARLYVKRGFWTKTLAGIFAVLFGIIMVYQMVFVRPARKEHARAVQAVEQAWQQFQQSHPSPGITPVGQRLYQKAKKALDNNRTETAESKAKSLEQLALLPGQMDTKKKQVVATALEQSARKKAEHIYRQGRQALADGRIDDARQSIRNLDQLLVRLRQEFTLKIVSRPNEPSGIYRVPENNPSTRNYYIIVEAVTPDGKRLSLPVTSEEDSRPQMVSKWGLRVSASFFDKIKRDKMDDGIIQNNRFGVKKRGYLTLEYLVPTTGAAITKW